MTEIFNYLPVAQPTGIDNFRVTRVQFGDGYSQAISEGINNHTQEWQMEFAGKHIEAIRQFFLKHAGWRSFEWVNPLGEKGLYRVDAVTTRHHGNKTVSISCKFTQVFHP